MNIIATDTKPISGRSTASTTRFIYMEHIPRRCVASSMQLFHRPEDGTAELGRPWSPDHVWTPEAAPTGKPVRIRPGDRIVVGDHTFEVYVTEGMQAIFPDLRRVA